MSDGFLRIGERIASWRQLLDLDQASLARKMGVHPSTISRWEATGSSTEPTYSSLASIAAAMGITLEVFFGPATQEALDGYRASSSAAAAS